MTRFDHCVSLTNHYIRLYFVVSVFLWFLNHNCVLYRPVTDRDVVLKAEGYDLLDEYGCYALPIRSATEVRSSLFCSLLHIQRQLAKN